MPIEIRGAAITDAASMWQLVCDCDVLDTNSCYAYLLMCRDFSGTTLVAVSEHGLAGFVTSYIPPSRPGVVFVWQVATAPSARGTGVGKQLLISLLRRDACRDVRFLEATVTPSNGASRRLFQAVARELEAGFEWRPGFRPSDFRVDAGLATAHEPEELIRIGPIKEQR